MDSKLFYSKINVALFFKDLFFYWERRVMKEKESQRKKSSLCWLTPEIAATEGVELVWSQEAGAPPGCPEWMQRPKNLAILHCFPSP